MNEQAWRESYEAQPRRGTVYKVAMCRHCDREIQTADTVDGSWSHVGYGVECPADERRTGMMRKISVWLVESTEYLTTVEVPDTFDFVGDDAKTLRDAVLAQPRDERKFKGETEVSITWAFPADERGMER